MRKILAVAFIMIMSCSIANAIPLDGSISIGALGATQNGANLSVSTVITPTVEFFGIGQTDLSVVPGFTFITGTSLDLTNLMSFSWTSSIGTWTTTSGTIISQTATSLEVFFLGTLLPAGVLSGYDNSLASERISLTQNGSSVSWSATLSAPPENMGSTPEPSSLLLVGGGLLALGIGAVRSRRKNHKG